MPDMNGQKQFLWKLLAIAMTIILTLVGTIWAITWGTNQKVDIRQENAIAENLKQIHETKAFIAEQRKTNEMLEKFIGDQHEITLQILKEVSK